MGNYASVFVEPYFDLEPSQDSEGAFIKVKGCANCETITTTKFCCDCGKRIREYNKPTLKLYQDWSDIYYDHIENKHEDIYDEDSFITYAYLQGSLFDNKCGAESIDIEENSINEVPTNIKSKIEVFKRKHIKLIDIFTKEGIFFEVKYGIVYKND